MQVDRTGTIVIIMISAVVLGTLLVYLSLDTGDEQNEGDSSMGVLAGEPVEDSAKSYADAILTDCGLDPHCAAEQMEELSESEDRDTVLATFNQVLSRYEMLDDYCHDESHHFALFLYNYFDGNLTEALAHVDRTCGGGVYHGLMETHLFWKVYNENTGEDLDVTTLCPAAENPYEHERYECVHGLGHGLTIYHGYNMSLAAKHCEEFDFKWDRTSCLKGAFMENVVYYYRLQKGDFDRNDIFYPCNELDEDYAPACYNYQASYILAKTGFVVRKTLAECNKIVPEEYIKHCYRGVGGNLILRSLPNIEKGINLCQDGKPEYQTHCLQGLAFVLFDHKGVDTAMELCKLVPIDFKVDCYDKLGQLILTEHVGYEERREACSRAESEEYFDICMDANLEGVELL